MIATVRETIAAIRDSLAQLDAKLLAVEADKRELPSLPLARGLVDLASARGKLCKTADRLIELARIPTPEPSLFDHGAEDN